MKLDIQSKYPHKWDKLDREEDDRQILVRHLRLGSLTDGATAVNVIADVAVTHQLQDQVQYTLDNANLLIVIHHSDQGPIDDSHVKLASAIDSSLGLS